MDSSMLESCFFKEMVKMQRIIFTKIFDSTEKIKNNNINWYKKEPLIEIH